MNSLVLDCRDVDSQFLSPNDLLLHNIAVTLSQYEIELTIEQMADLAMQFEKDIEKIEEENEEDEKNKGSG